MLGLQSTLKQVSVISDLRGDKTKLSLLSDAFPTGPWSCVWLVQPSLSKDPVVIPTLISAHPHCLILFLFPPSQVVCNILGLSFVRSSALEVSSVQFSSVQSLSRARLFATLWTAAHQASLSITNSRSLLKLMSIESVVPSNHLILSCPLLLLPSVFPSIKVFSDESAWFLLL